MYYQEGFYTNEEFVLVVESIDYKHMAPPVGECGNVSLRA